MHPVSTLSYGRILEDFQVDTTLLGPSLLELKGLLNVHIPSIWLNKYIVFC